MSSSERKTKQATPRKLRKSREDGEVAQGKKAIALLSVAVLMGAAVAMLKSIGLTLARLFDTIFVHIGQPVTEVWDVAAHDTGTALMEATVPFVGLSVFAVVGSTIAYHRGIPFSMKPIVPNFTRLNPAQGFKRMFGKRSWVETGVGLVQLVIWVSISYTLITYQMEDMLDLHACGLSCMEVVAWRLFRNIAIAALVLFLLLAVIETVLQAALYKNEQKMTATEYRREMKDSFGAPEIRRARARMRMEDQFFNTVDPEVIGVDMANMCFYSKKAAVAIRYHPEVAPIPMICAVASGAEVETLRNTIRQNGFPETRSRKVAETCLRRPVGTPAPQSIHKDLAAGISRMFEE